MHHDDIEDHDRGLAFDLDTLSRRGALGLLGGAGLVALVGCGSGSNSADSTASPTTSVKSSPTKSATPTSTPSATETPATAAECEEIPQETGGPYPADGSNGPNVLTESGIVRSDIRKSFGSASGVADGIPFTFELTVLDTAKSCAVLAGAAVYAWHCNQTGEYSLYSEGIANENYLRGVQRTDKNGVVSFTSIFPACYSGRWPHVHFEVYASQSDATSAKDPLVTSQMALPQDICEKVYATDGYSASVDNLSRVSLQNDMVFSDGWTAQMATVTGSTSAGYTATLAVPV